MTRNGVLIFYGCPLYFFEKVMGLADIVQSLSMQTPSASSLYLVALSLASHTLQYAWLTSLHIEVAFSLPVSPPAFCSPWPNHSYYCFSHLHALLKLVPNSLLPACPFLIRLQPHICSLFSHLATIPRLHVLFYV